MASAACSPGESPSPETSWPKTALIPNFSPPAADGPHVGRFSKRRGERGALGVKRVAKRVPKRTIEVATVVANVAVAGSVIWLANRDLVSDFPIWLLVGGLFAGAVATRAAGERWPDDRPGSERRFRITVKSTVTAGALLLCGWNPLLALAVGGVLALNVVVLGSQRIMVFALEGLALALLAVHVVVKVIVESQLLVSTSMLGGIAAAVLYAVITGMIMGDGASERVRKMEHRERRDEQLRAMVYDEHGVTGVMSEQGVFRYLTPTTRPFLGHAPGFLLGRSLTDIVHIDDLARAGDLTLEALANSDGTFVAPMRIRDSEGAWRWTEAKVSNRVADPDYKGLMVSFRDVDERHTFEDQTAYGERHDVHTRLPGAELFMERVAQAEQWAGVHGSIVALALLELDAAIVEGGGENAGPGETSEACTALMPRLAERLGTCMRGGDTIARLDDTLFGVLFQDLSHVDDTTIVARRIADACALPFVVGGQRVMAYVRLGASTTKDEPALEGLRDRAEVALRFTTNDGEARLQRFTGEMVPGEMVPGDMVTGEMATEVLPRA